MKHDHAKMIRHAMIIAKHLASGGHVILTHRRHLESGGDVGGSVQDSSPSDTPAPAPSTPAPEALDPVKMKGAPLDFAHLNLPASFTQGFVPSPANNVAMPPMMPRGYESLPLPNSSGMPPFNPMSYFMPEQAPLAQGPRTFARGGYATDGSVDDPVVSPMGDTFISAPQQDYSNEPGYDIVRKAQDVVADYGKRAGEPLKDAAQNYLENVYKEAGEGSHMMSESGKSLRMENGRLPINAMWQYPMGAIQTLSSPLTGGVESGAQFLTNVTGDPTFGEKAGFLGNLVGPGEAKLGAKMAMAAIPGAKDASAALKLAREVKPVAEAQRGILATPDLRQLSRDEAIEVARNEPHLIQDSTGQYVGAPRGVDSPEKIKAMREAFDKDVAAGAEGGDWYERAREFNREVAGDNPYRQRLTANEQALWSAQANPDTNQGFALNARTDYEAGVPKEKYRTGQQARNYIEARQALDEAKENKATEGMMGHNQGPAMDVDLSDNPDVTGLARLGKKTGIYGQHLDPTVPPATTGTNDIWHARGFGYTNKDGSTFSRALSDQEHRFLDYETMLAVDRANAANLAGRNNWTGAEIQAAPWVAGKGRAMANRGNMTLEQGIAEASKTYPDTAPKYTMSTPIEQIPGASTGLLPNLIDADQATKEAFTKRADWKDPNGRDKLWDELNFDTRRTNDAQGAYRNSAGELEFNPVEVGRPMTGFESNAQGNPIVNPAAQAGFSMGQAARGLVDFQEGTPWNKFITHGAGPDKTSIHMNIGRNATNEELQKLEELGQKHGLMLTNTEGGVGFINFKDGQTTTSVGKDLRQGLMKDIKDILPDADVKRARFNGDYFDLAEEGVRQIAKENQGQGLATKKLFDTLSELKAQAPNYYERILDSQVISDKAKANLDRLIEYGGKGQRPDYERLLKIIGEDKYRGLLDRVNKLGYQGLPVAAGAVGLQGVRSNSSSSKDQ